ncbi:hypothetical protein [Streptomyces globosus]|uniref:hypothetical protein n=1 Tax=Streptomyces globosus TaxID=68209 RepID=UPI0031D4A313
MGTWQQQLRTARTWRDYRRALHTFWMDGLDVDTLGELGRTMAERAAPAFPGRAAADGFDRVLDRTLPDAPPDWAEVELCVRTRAEHRPGEDADGLVAQWADGYRACGGDPGPRTPQRRLAQPRWRQRAAWTAAVLLIAAGVAGGAFRAGDWWRDRQGPAGNTARPEESPADRKTPDGTDGSRPSSPSSPGLGPDSTPPPPADGGAPRTKPQAPAPAPTPSRSFAAVIKWSDDGANGTDPSPRVWAYDSPTEGGDAHHNGFYEPGQQFYVQCQVTNGRTFPLGDAYKGPGREGVWYRVQPGKWVPAAYVDAGTAPLPAC